MKRFYPLALTLVLLSFFSMTLAAESFTNPTLTQASKKIEDMAGKTNTPDLQSAKTELNAILHSIDDSIRTRNKTAFVQGVTKFQAKYRVFVALINSTPKVPSTPAKTIENIETIPANILYYSDSLEGKRTSSGDPFSQAFFSSARCNVPLNTLIQAINNNKSVIVKNNDRPDCNAHPDIIDLTKNSFSSIGKLTSGKLSGSIVPLKPVAKNYVKKYLSTNTFSTLGIKLNENIPNTYLKNETIQIGGLELLKNENVLLYLQSPSGKDISLWWKRNTDGSFEFAHPLEEIGTYHLVVTSWLGFETNKYADINVLDPALFSGKKLFSPGNTTSIESLAVERVEFSDLKADYVFSFPTRDYYTLELRQGSLSAFYSGMGKISLQSTTLSGFDKQKNVDVTVSVQKSSTAFSHDTYSEPSVVFSKTMMLDAGYETEKKENIQVRTEGRNLIISGTVSKEKNVRSEVVLTMPDGSVKAYPIDKTFIDKDGYVKRNTPFEKNIYLDQKGQYLVELNYDTGFAAYNWPALYGDVLPVLPSDYDRVEKTISGDVNTIRLESLKFINEFRAKMGKSTLSLDDTLTYLASIKASDMAENNYLSHTDSKWEKILGTAKRNGIQIASSIGENIAGGNVSAGVLLIGLINSGGHRENILGDWKKVWIWYAVKNGQVYYAQVFGN